MILTNQQALMLMQVLSDSLQYKDNAYFKLSFDTRKNLLEHILSQQSKELVELENLSNLAGTTLQ